MIYTAYGSKIQKTDRAQEWQINRHRRINSQDMRFFTPNMTFDNQKYLYEIDSFPYLNRYANSTGNRNNFVPIDRAISAASHGFALPRIFSKEGVVPANCRTALYNHNDSFFDNYKQE
jgi:hypothetical protein